MPYRIIRKFYHKLYQKVFIRRMEGGEVPEEDIGRSGTKATRAALILEGSPIQRK